MVLTWIEPIDQFVLERVTMVLCIGVSFRVVAYDLWVNVNLDEHIQWSSCWYVVACVCVLLPLLHATDVRVVHHIWVRIVCGVVWCSFVHYKYPAISQPGSS